MNKDKPINILLIYHGTECIDGFTSAWLAHVAWKNACPSANIKLYPMNYGEEEEHKLVRYLTPKIESKEYSMIYVLDFSLRLEILAEIVARNKAQIIILDHHKTAFNMYFPEEQRAPDELRTKTLHGMQVLIYLNNAASGAGMTHKYFFPAEKVPLLVQHVQDRDIWTKKMPNTDAVHRYLMQAPKNIGTWTDINADMSHAEIYKRIVAEGNRLLNAHNATVSDIALLSEPISIAGSKGRMVECDYEYTSDVGNLLAKESGTFGMTYVKAENGENLHCSLRSEGDYDVEVLAKRYGGGGHKNAAGFSIDYRDLTHGELP